jgi:hypothetical protein
VHDTIIRLSRSASARWATSRAPAPRAGRWCFGLTVAVLYFVTGSDAWLFWISLILLPLALFWILAGVLFWTVRWIRRGFTQSKSP